MGESFGFAAFVQISVNSKNAPDTSVQGHYSFPADLNVNGKEEISVQTMLIVVREKYSLFKFRMAERTFCAAVEGKRKNFSSLRFPDFGKAVLCL